MKLFSYVVQHDTGYAPNPYFGSCTLCRCKFKQSRKGPNGHKAHPNVIERAKPGDWVIGTGGVNLAASAGHGKLVYAMRVEEKLTRGQYLRRREFRSKRPIQNGTYAQQRGDNESPSNSYQEKHQFVLISRKQFYYFGKNAISIKQFRRLEKKGPGFRSQFDKADVERFVKWITRKQSGKHGEPCAKDLIEARKAQGCKPYCWVNC